MARAAQSVIPLILNITSGNTAATAMREIPHAAVNSGVRADADSADAANEWRGSGIEAGGRIVLGTATTAVILVKDGTGKVLFNATVTANTDVDPIPAGVTGPITVTATSVSDSSTGTLTVYWWVKK